MVEKEKILENLRKQFNNANEELIKKKEQFDKEIKDLKSKAQQKEKKLLQIFMKKYEEKISEMENKLNTKIVEFKDDILNSI